MSADQVRPLRHLLGGEWVGEADAERRNPSDTREVVATLPRFVPAHVEKAVEAARSAQTAWAAASPEYRADILDRAGTIVMDRAQDLARLLSREEGKTLAEATGEVGRAGRILRYFAGEAIRLHGGTLSSTRPGVSVRTHREPLGAVALITPWNFPIAIPAWKAAPALAFGNTVVLKPSSLSAATAVALAEILVEAGLPDGVLNVIMGDADAGRQLVAHPGIAAVSFTGSQAVGARVAAMAAERQARVQLEMGGKNPLVILDDADLERAVPIALDGAFFGTGQRCTASSRLVVTEAIHDRFVDAMVRGMSALRVGHALGAETKIGPVVSDSQQARINGYIERARSAGATTSTNGAAIENADRGWYVRPTLVTDTTSAMEINRDEIFGPVASVQRVRGYDEALLAANQGDFGLSAGIATTSLKHARHFERNVRAGMVMINLPTAGVDYHVPFGGMGTSSYGSREQGFAAAEFYTQHRTVYETG